VGAAWLNLIKRWWRIFRRKVFAGQSQADDHYIAYVTQLSIFAPVSFIVIDERRNEMVGS